MGERFEDLTREFASQPTSRRAILKILGAALGAVGAATVLRPWRGEAVTCAGPTTIGASPCAAGTTPCGPCCCNKGVACLHPTNGVCGCPAGTTPCGDACCK